MTREDLIKSREYWITTFQLQMFNLIEKYRKDNNLNKTELAIKLGVTKGYITQILNGDFDHKMSKFIDLSLAFDKVPILDFVDIDTYIDKDANSRVYALPSMSPSEASTKENTSGAPIKFMYQSDKMKSQYYAK
ncbi:MAG TPA: helix-turn-helix transcriptional regulator [Puia sp.]|nr:helix-turn-helix transcriptional regulator [Puia sp.]